MVLPSSSRLATGLPATATPASLPRWTAATANLPPTVGRLWQWYLAMKAFASLMWIGAACTLPLILSLFRLRAAVVNQACSPNFRPKRRHRLFGVLGLSLFWDHADGRLPGALPRSRTTATR